MFQWIKTLLTRNPCKECDYYHKANKTCHSKKCCTGGYGHVTFLDRLLCEPYKGGCDDCDFCELNKVLSAAPTVNAEPVRHGRWVTFNVIDIKDCSSKIRYMCNKCGRYEDEQEPYCNCGAKMDGGK